MNCICFRQSIKSNESDRLHCIARQLDYQLSNDVFKGPAVRVDSPRAEDTPPSRNCCWSMKFTFIIYLLFMRPKFKHNLTSVHPFVHRFDHKLIKAIHPFQFVQSSFFDRSIIIYRKNLLKNNSNLDDFFLTDHSFFLNSVL